MKKLFSILVALAIIIIIVLSCRDDNDPVEKEPVIKEINKPVVVENEAIEKIVDGDKVKASIVVCVFDEESNPIVDANVLFADLEVKTNENGVAILESENFNSNHTFIKVRKAGFFSGSRAMNVSEGNSFTAKITLLKNDKVEKVESSKGGEVKVDENVGLNFPANTIVTESGEVYEGEIAVAARYIDPKSESFSSEMPGDLVAVDDENNVRTLVSYGMTNIELTDKDGNPLNIGGGGDVEMKMPASEDSPEEMPMWYFDEKLGIWIQEGVAVKKNGEYVGKVKHFSLWNLDMDFGNTAKYTFTLKDTDGNVLDGIETILMPLNKANFTDNKGELTIFRAPSDIELQLVFNFAHGKITKDIGKVTEDKTEEIVVDISKLKIQIEYYNCDYEPKSTTFAEIKLTNKDNKDIRPFIQLYRTDINGVLDRTIPVGLKVNYGLDIKMDDALIKNEFTSEHSTQINFGLVRVCENKAEKILSPVFINKKFEPSDESSGIIFNPVLKCEVFKLSDKPFKYSFYFGKDKDNLKNIASDLTVPRYKLSEKVEINTSYYWKVIATSDNFTLESKVNSYTTLDNLEGYAPEFVEDKFIPANNSKDMEVFQKLEWMADDPQNDSLTYSVYFGASTDNMELIAENIKKNSFNLEEELIQNTDYYWSILARDGIYTTLSSKIKFTTLKDAPLFIDKFYPADGSTGVDISSNISFKALDKQKYPLKYTLYLGKSIEGMEKVASSISDTVYKPESDLDINSNYYWKVVADNGVNNVTSDIISFKTVDNINKLKPQFVEGSFSPIKNSSDIAINPKFTFKAIDLQGDKLSYNIYLGLKEDALSIVSEKNQDTTYTSAQDLSFDTEYYWKVSASDGKYTTDSDIFKFKTLRVAPIYDVSKFFPEENTLEVLLKPELKWEFSDPQNDPVSYSVYLSTDIQDNKPVVEGLTETSYKPAENLEFNKVYYWKIVASDGKYSAESPTFMFTTVEGENKVRPKFDYQQFTPQSNSIDLIQTPELVWSASDPQGDKLVYTIYWGVDDKNLDNIKSNISDTKFTIESPLAENTEYYWKVMAFDGEFSSVSDIFKFKTQKVSPEFVYSDFSPKNSALDVPYSVNLECNATDPQNDNVTYKFFMGTNKNTLIEHSSNSGGKILALNGLKDNTTYYWYVKASDGVNTSNSDIYSFETIQKSVPEFDINGFTPTDKSVGVSTYPSLSWKCTDKDGDALKYNLNFGKIKNALESKAIGLATNSYNITELLEDETTYYWSVTVNDGENTVSSDINSFNTYKDKPTFEENKFYPLNNSIASEQMLELKWNAIDLQNESLKYTVKFGKDQNQMNVIASNLSNNKFSLTDKLEENTIYYWSVSVSDGKHEIISDNISFTTAKFSPTFDTNSFFPKDNTIGHSNTPMLGWSASDSQGDELKFDIFIGESKDNLDMIANDVITSEYQVATVLTLDKIYYWKVVAKDKFNKTFSSVLQFKVYPTTKPIIEFFSVKNPSYDYPEYLNISWRSKDYNDDEVSYKIFAGKDIDNLIKVNEGITLSANSGDKTYKYDVNLVPTSDYYFMLEVSDGNSVVKSGVEKFTTEKFWSTDNGFNHIIALESRNYFDSKFTNEALLSIKRISYTESGMIDPSPSPGVGPVFYPLRGLHGIQYLENLETFYVSYQYNGYMKEDQIKYFANLKNIVEYTFIKIDFEGQVKYLKNNLNMKKLILKFCELKNSDLKDLQPFSKLEYLDISNNNDISDITELLKLTSLKHIDIGNTGISSADKDRLKEAFPDAVIK